MSEADEEYMWQRGDLFDKDEGRIQAHHCAAGPSVRCPYCGSPTRRRDSAVVYGDNAWGGEVIVCTRFPVCDAFVGCHDDGEPLGTLADKRLRAARMAAHAAFDPIWKGHEMPRAKAYAWLAKALGTRPADTHIGLFDIAQCEAVVQACTVRQFGGLS
jgi:hypothetical protein